MILLFASLLVASFALADSFLFVQDGKITSGPRELPSVGVRLDTKQAVLGLHGADDATRAACGWYRVIPSTAKAASNQVVAAQTYTIGKSTAQEVLTLTNVVRKTYTAQERIEDIFDDVIATSDSERAGIILKAVAAAVTNRIRSAVTITIPTAATKEIAR
jgi:hypothetical protein